MKRCITALAVLLATGCSVYVDPATETGRTEHSVRKIEVDGTECVFWTRYKYGAALSCNWKNN